MGAGGRTDKGRLPTLWVEENWNTAIMLMAMHIIGCLESSLIDAVFVRISYALVNRGVLLAQDMFLEYEQ